VAVRVFWLAEVGEGEKDVSDAARGLGWAKGPRGLTPRLGAEEKNMKRPLTTAAVLTALVWIGTAVVYPRLPETMTTHWNIKGEADGFSPKAQGAFILPASMILMLGVAAVLPRISPKHFEVDTFKSTYWMVMLLVLALFAYLHVITLWAGVNGRIDVGRALFGGIFGFLAIMGNYLSKVRRNFWMGVRTPWTLASDRVWNDTHRLASKTFVIAGAGGVIVTLLPLPLGAWMGLGIGLILLGALIPVVYSLVHYKQLQARGEL
jgi:uncharacterized membrane protein